MRTQNLKAFYVAILHLLNIQIISCFKISVADYYIDSDVKDDHAYHDSDDDSDDNDAYDDE